MCKQCGLANNRGLLDLPDDNTLFDALANLDQLRRTGGGMNVEPPPLRPVIGVSDMVIDIAEHQIGFCAMHDDADIAIDAYRPEVFVFCAIEFVKVQAGAGRIQLKVESGGLRDLAHRRSVWRGWR